MKLTTSALLGTVDILTSREVIAVPMGAEGVKDTYLQQKILENG